MSESVKLQCLASNDRACKKSSILRRQCVDSTVSFSQCCVFPDKAGSRNDVTNYRGIPILSAMAKLFELLIYKNMYKDLQRLISENQHGYVNGRSTVSDLLEYTSFILKFTA
jgi:hypothetical protein